MSATCVRAAGTVLGAAIVAVSWAALLLAPSGAAAPAGTGRTTAGDLSATGHRSGTAGSGGAITLASQSPWVLPGSPLDLEIQRRAGLGPSGLGLTVTVYDRLHTASAFQRSLSTVSSDDVVDHTAVVPLSELAVPGQTLLSRITVSVAAGGTTTTTPTQAALDLDCTSDCAGVYPMVVTVSRISSGATVGRLTTFLTYETSTTSPSPLRVALVLPVEVPVSFTGAPSGGPTATAPRAALDAECTLVSLLARQRVPVTVEAVPQTVQAMARRCRAGTATGTQKSGSGGGAAASAASGRRHRSPGNALAAVSGTRAVVDLALMSADQSTFALPAQTYVATDPSVLTAAGLGGEVTAQMARGQQVLDADHVQTLRGTWVLTEAPGGDLRAGLAAVQADHLVLPETDLSSLPDTTLTQPFHVDLGHGRSVLAAGSDTEAAALTTAHPGDPVLAATQLLADLALVQSELPDASEPRGLVVVPPPGWRPDAAFVGTLLQGLTKNPTMDPLTLAQLFSTVPAGGNGQDGTRGISGAGPGLSARSAGAIGNGRSRLTSFASAATQATGVLASLDDDLLATEASTLTTQSRAVGLAAFTRALGAQVASVQLSDARTITLTSQRASLPVTILSSAPYAVVGHLTLSSDKLQFPDGATRTVTIDRNTNQVRVPVRARTSGDLPMEVTLTAPSGGLVIARGRITVRSTATSVVGVVLTVVALVVLLGWWARTWWRGRRARRAGATAR